MATNNSIDSNLPIPIAKGGTNAASMATSYGVAYFDGSKIVTVASVGTATQALTSNGPSSAPSFQNFTGGGSGVGTSSVLASLASTVTTTLTGNQILICGTEIFDTANEYNSSTGIFTASNTGFYLASVAIYIGGSAYSYEVGWSANISFNTCSQGALAADIPYYCSLGEKSIAAGAPQYAGKPHDILFYSDSGDSSYAFFRKIGLVADTISANLGDGTFMSVFLIG